jgi:hypothetical protein
MSKKTTEQSNPLLWPSVDSMMADALGVIQLEITKYKTKVAQGRSLDSREAKTLQGYIKSLVDLSREDRERIKEQDLSQLSTEELLALLGNKVPQLGERSDR